MSDLVMVIDSGDDDALEIVEDEEEVDDDDVDNGEADDDVGNEGFSNSNSPDQGLSAPIELVIENQRPGTKHPFKYKCPFCNKYYTSRSGLTSHKNAVHFKAKPYRYLTSLINLSMGWLGCPYFL